MRQGIKSRIFLTKSKYSLYSPIGVGSPSLVKEDKGCEEMTSHKNNGLSEHPYRLVKFIVDMNNTHSRLTYL